MHFFVAKLLSIAVMTDTYAYHLRNLRPIRLICYAHSEQTSACDRRTCVRMTATPLSFGVSFPENPREYPQKLYCQKLEPLSYMTAAIVYGIIGI